MLKDRTLVHVWQWLHFNSIIVRIWEFANHVRIPLNPSILMSYIAAWYMIQCLHVQFKCWRTKMGTIPMGSLNKKASGTRCFKMTTQWRRLFFWNLGVLMYPPTGPVRLSLDAELAHYGADASLNKLLLLLPNSISIREPNFRDTRD